MLNINVLSMRVERKRQSAVKLGNYHELGLPVAQSIPSPEHYLPLLYVLALKTEEESATFFNEKTVMGSISMTSVKIAQI